MPQKASSAGTHICFPVTLRIQGVGHIPSHKNRKRAIMDKSMGHLRTLTEPPVRERMQRIENAITFALYSLCQTNENVTHSECLKQLRTALSGLCDDSIKEVPEGSWYTEHVPQGEEGCTITIVAY